MIAKLWGLQQGPECPRCFGRDRHVAKGHKAEIQLRRRREMPSQHAGGEGARADRKPPKRKAVRSKPPRGGGLRPVAWRNRRRLINGSQGRGAHRALNRSPPPRAAAKSRTS